MTFWKRYYELCNRKGRSPNAVASELGFSNATCTKWKNGSEPSSKSVARIAEYFNVSTDYLLGNEPNENTFVSDDDIKFAFELELTENEKRILEIFKRLSESQQGQIIGRAELMAEYSLPANTQSNKQYQTRIAAYGGGNIETTHTEEQLARAIKATEELKKKRK